MKHIHLFIICSLLLLLLPSHAQAAPKKIPKDKKNYKYDVAIAAIFQNEGPYLREWIEFHKLVGVQHFYLYNNDSEDNPREILADYINSGEVELLDWPSNKNTWSRFCYGVQAKAYDNAIRKASGVAKWLALIDLDEFLFPAHENTLIECLNNHFNTCAGVYVNWQMFGTSGVKSISPSELMIERLVMKAPVDYVANLDSKSIIRPEYATRCPGPHFVVYKPGYGHVNSNLEPVGYANDGVYIDKIRINHYWSRDEDYLYNQKIPRYQRFKNPAYTNVAKQIEEKVTQLNQLYDDAILRYAPALRHNMGL